MNFICGGIISTIIILSGDTYCPQGVIIDGGALYLNNYTLYGEGNVGVVLRGKDSYIGEGRIAQYYVGIHRQSCENCFIHSITIKAHYPLLEDTSILYSE